MVRKIKKGYWKAVCGFSAWNVHIFVIVFNYRILMSVHFSRRAELNLKGIWIWKQMQLRARAQAANLQDWGYYINILREGICCFTHQSSDVHNHGCFLPHLHLSVALRTGEVKSKDHMYV